MNHDLIFDVGLHKGEDTAFYLKKGFRVVAFEANPDLIDICKKRFSDEISSGQLNICHGAIADASQGTTIKFYTSSESVWGTTSLDWASRNMRLGARQEAIIEVNRVDIDEVFEQYGIPYYLKVDVEGVDNIVLDALVKFTDKPMYISVESSKKSLSDTLDEIKMLQRLGYNKFKAIQQESIPGTTIHTATLNSESFEFTFESHSSGPFGEETPGSWRTASEILEDYKRIHRTYQLFGDDSFVSKMPYNVRRGFRATYRITTGHSGPLPGWFDTHARR